jgi:hypothetical protein
MAPNRMTRRLQVAALTLATSPLILLVLFFAYVVRARLHLGHWPHYNHPDPKQLGWWIQHSLLQIGFIGFPVMALTAVGLALAGRWRSREFPTWIIIGMVVLASSALVAFARFDPGGFMNWFWD